MRVLGVDIGRRRVGLAISDPTGTLARPLTTVAVASGDEQAAAASVLREIERLAADDDGLAGVVVGMPRHLDGTPSEETAMAARFVRRLKASTTVPVYEEDERLTSREAESRLALRERDWRKRKKQIDEMAAAIILQDYLDRPRP